MMKESLIQRISDLAYQSISLSVIQFISDSDDGFI